MSARRKGSVDLGYTEKELRLAMRAVKGLQTGRWPQMSYEEWEIAERGAAILDALETKQARLEARAT